MSKKTKEEKILAAYRKKIKLLEEINLPKNQPTIKVNESKIENPKADLSTKDGAKTDNRKPNTEDISRRTYFLQDLKKSLFIISLIITLEIIIYFVSINRYLIK